MRIPSSKSITHRALFCAATVSGKSVLINPLVCDDTLASVDVLKVLGIVICRQAQQAQDERWVIDGGTFQKPSEKLFCNESGTTYRFVTALTDILQIPCEITGKPSLLRRPQRPDPTISSQYLSGLLLAEPLAKKPLHIDYTSCVSKPYIDLTLDIRKKFAHPTTFEIEADWSSAAYPLALGVLCNGVALEGLNPESLQGDKAIVTILKEMGADIFWKEKTLVAKKSKLKGLRWDFEQTPDLYPIVAVLCELAEGKSELIGLERLRLKESDRVAEMQQLLAYVNNDHMLVDSKDHRIIMAAAVLAKATGKKLEFKYSEAVSKSWPGFWENFL